MFLLEAGIVLLKSWGSVLAFLSVSGAAGLWGQRGRRRAWWVTSLLSAAAGPASRPILGQSCAAAAPMQQQVLPADAPLPAHRSARDCLSFPGICPLGVPVFSGAPG